MICLPAGVYHLETEVLAKIVGHVSSFRTVWSLRGVCLEFFRLIMGDVESTQTLARILRNSHINRAFLLTLGTAFYFSRDSGAMMRLMVNSYTRSLNYLLRVTQRSMLEMISLRKVQVRFYRDDGSFHATFPNLSLEHITEALKMRVAFGNFVSDAEENKLRQKVVDAIIENESWGITPYSSFNLFDFVMEYKTAWLQFVDEADQDFLEDRLVEVGGMLSEERVYTTLASKETNKSTRMYSEPKVWFANIAEGDFFSFPLLELDCTDESYAAARQSLLTSKNVWKHLSRIGIPVPTGHLPLEAGIDTLKAGIDTLIKLFLPDTTFTNIDRARKANMPIGLLHLTNDRRHTKNNWYTHRSLVYRILSICYPKEVPGDELLLDMSEAQVLSSTWNISKYGEQFIRQYKDSIGRAYRTQTANLETMVDESRPGHRESRTKRGSINGFHHSMGGSGSKLRRIVTG